MLETAQRELETARRYAISLSLNKYKALRKGDDSIKKTVGDDELLRPNEKLAQEIVDKRTKRPRPRVSFPVPKAAARAQREAEERKLREDWERLPAW